MRKKLVVSATLLFVASLPWQADASTFNFSFTGAGVSGTVALTYGAATDAKYSQAFEVTGISGTLMAATSLTRPLVRSCPSRAICRNPPTCWRRTISADSR